MKFKIKKKLLLIVLSVMAVFMVISGCDKTDRQVPQLRIVMAQSFELYDDESAELSAKVFSDEEEIERTLNWSSSNEAVLTVDLKGRIRARSAGSAVVTASLEEGAKAECCVTVLNRGYYPAFSLNAENRLYLQKGAEFTVESSLILKNETISAYTVQWELLSGTEQFSLMPNENASNKAVLKGLDYGKGILRATAKYENEVFFEELELYVVEEDIEFSLEHPQLSYENGEYFADLVKVALSEESVSELMPAVTLKKASIPIDAPALMWSSSDPQTVSVGNDGKITALAEGRSIVTVQYVSANSVLYEIKINVTVRSEEVSAERKIYFEEATGQPFRIETKLLEGEEVTGYGLDGREFLGNVTRTEDAVTFEKGEIAFGVHKISLYTNFGTRSFEVVVCTKAIGSAEELDKMGEYATKHKADFKGDTGADAYFWTGYFVLKNDIDYQNKSYETFCDYTQSGDSWNAGSGFRGTFDGDGYTISNIKFEKAAGGIFGNLGTDSVFKNVNLVNVDNAAWSGVVCNFCFGRIENVFISGKYSGNPNQSAGASMLVGKSSTGSVNHVFIVVDGEPSNVETNPYAGAITRNNTLNINNLVIVGASKLFGDPAAVNNGVTSYADKTAYLASDSLDWSGWVISADDYPKYKG